MSFPFIVDKIPFSYWITNALITGGTLWWLLVIGDDKCEPYFRTFSKFDLIVSGLAYLNAFLEVYMENVKKTTIGLSILQRYHEEVQTKFQERLLQDFKDIRLKKDSKLDKTN